MMAKYTHKKPDIDPGTEQVPHKCQLSTSSSLLSITEH